MKKIAFIISAFFLYLPAMALCDMPKSFDAKRPELLRKFAQVGVSSIYAKNILSDKRLEYYEDFFNGKGRKLGDKITLVHGICEAESIKKGRQVMEERKYTLDRIYEKYGVHPEYIVSIYWIETRLGTKLGRHLVINSLLTWILSPKSKRKNWAEKELVAFAKICHKNEFDPFLIKGSLAGAFGRTQFIPTSYISFAESADGNGKADLFNVEDALFSTANYLYCNGWDKNDFKKIRKAIYAYNHSESYVNAVVIYAELLKSPIICRGD